MLQGERGEQREAHHHAQRHNGERHQVAPFRPLLPQGEQHQPAQQRGDDGRGRR